MKKTFEIECKAWVDDPGVLRDKLNDLYEYKTRYIKNDTYYNFPGKNRTFRVRMQNDEAIVTVKKKSREKGIEENLEVEFTVSDSAAFLSFIAEFECPVYVTKRKNTEVYVSGNTTIELSFVDTLGWFIEIEQLVTRDADVNKNRAKEEIIGILADLGIPEEKIEERYYTELLTGLDEK